MDDSLKQINLQEPSPSTNTNQSQEPTQPMSTLESPTKSNPRSSSASKARLVAVSLAVVAGLVVGFIIAQNRLKSTATTTADSSGMTQNPESASDIKVGQVFGSQDEESFRDPATGIIQPGGIKGEGSHHLERGTDESQWVYLTSSVVDLDLFVGTEVDVWGETFQGKSAGWLMDVGRLKVIKLNAAEINNIEADN